jgi:hypothetical protein
MAQDILARARSAEEKLSRNPVHQQFRIEVVQLKPEKQRREGRLSIWSDPGSGRFASRWTDEAGELKHAVWRPAGNQLYIYDRAADARMVRLTKASAVTVSSAELARSGLSPDQLEASFMRLLEGRSWRPISLTRELAEFVTQDGLVVRMEKLPPERGRQAVRVTAEQSQTGRRAVLYIVLEEETLRPRIQSLRMETPDRVVELRLTAERTAVLSPGRVSRVFSPEWIKTSVFGDGVRFPESRRPREPALASLEPSLSVPSPSELSVAEVELRYLLHRSGACRGEPVEVVRESGSRIVVRGLVETPERKAELLAALSELETRPFVALQIETVEEAARSAPPPGELVSDESSLSGATVEFPPEEQMTVSSARRLPIEEELQRYFTENLGSPPVHEEVTRLSNRAVTLSEAALAEAWAVRRLAETYGPEVTAGLRPQSRWLLEVMLQDHLRNLRYHAGDMRELLAPVLLWMTGESLAPATTGPAAGDRGVADWNRAGLAIFDNVRQLHVSVVALFVGAGGPGAQRPLEVAGSLLEAFPLFEPSFQSLRDHLAREFPGDPRQFSLNESIELEEVGR